MSVDFMRREGGPLLLSFIDDRVILLPWKLATECRLPFREIRVFSQPSQQSHLLREHLLTSLVEPSADAIFVVRVAFGTMETGSDGGVDA